MVDVGDTCGNIDVTISGTSLNSNNEIFVGNYIEGFGSSYTYGATGFTISDTVGYYNTNGGTLLDWDNTRKPIKDARSDKFPGFEISNNYLINWEDLNIQKHKYILV